VSKAPSKNAVAGSALAELFIFGRDKAGRHRGGRFLSTSEQAAGAAAESGFLVAERPPIGFAELAMDLPLGHIDASGRPSLPTIKVELYHTVLWAYRQIEQLRQAELAGYASSQLLSALGVPELKDKHPVPPYPKMPPNWEMVDIGSLVLIHGGPEVGWWDAIVVDRTDDVLKLRLRDDPAQGVFFRHRNAVGLVNPGMC
jgi:hypothetical protein